VADYCQQCSIELFGEDHRELAGLGPEGQTLEPGYGWSVLCEGCGPTLVDDDGKCIAKCDLNHASNGGPAE